MDIMYVVNVKNLLVSVQFGKPFIQIKSIHENNIFFFFFSSHERVRGLFVWCQGCSHGGHQAHMRSWFSTNTTCPTGCGHQCSF